MFTCRAAQNAQLYDFFAGLPWGAVGDMALHVVAKPFHLIRHESLHAAAGSCRTANFPKKYLPMVNKALTPFEPLRRVPEGFGYRCCGSAKIRGELSIGSG